MTNVQIENVVNYLLNNVSELKQIASELNSWDGSLSQFNVWENDEDFFNTYFDGKPMEAVRAAHYGDYNYNDEYVRFDGYENLESLSEWEYEQELKDYVEEIIDLMIDNRSHIDIPAEVEELLDEEDEDEEE